MKYTKFEDWFHEVENYSTRSERFYDEFKNMTPERAKEWLQSAWDCSRQQHQPYYKGCPVCGSGSDGKAIGYVCYRSDCPIRITS